MFAKFCIVGASGVVVDMGILSLLGSMGYTWSALLAIKVIATECAIVNNFIWNDRWTFRATPPTSRQSHWLVRLIRFNVIAGSGLLVNGLVFSMQVFWFGTNIYIANGIAITVVSGFNYLLSRRYAWRALPNRGAIAV